MKTFQAATGQIARQWYVIDATDQIVGRLAAQIAPILMGKHRPTYTPHVDTGDFVVVTNVEKVVFTGQKWQQKSYQRYTGYPSGQREETAWKLHQRRPERILELAVARMMPKNKLGRHMMTKLRLYVGPEHPHQAQEPISLEPRSGRPAASGLLLAPPQVVNPPGSRAKKKKTHENAPPQPDTQAPAALLEPAPAPEPEIVTTPEPQVADAPPPESEPESTRSGGA